MKQDDKLPEIGKDEMNLVEFPITLLAKRRGSVNNTIKFTDTIEGENGKPVTREWIVTGTEEYGLPLAQDNDVLLAIMAIAKETNFSSPTIYFSRYRLLEIMGQDTKAGSNYNRLEESFDRLMGVTIKAINGFWDNEKKCYVTVSFGIIDNYVLYDSHKPAGQPGLPFCSVDLNKFLYQSIQAGYIKSLNIKTYFRLESAITKRLYRYLDKKTYNKKKFEIGLFNLAEVHLGLQKCKYLSQIKQQLSLAHEELIQLGFLRSAEYQKTAYGGSEKVVYHFGQQDLVKDIDIGHATETKENTTCEPLVPDPLLLDRLIHIGVTRKVAEQILREYPLETVKTQVEALPHRKAEDAPAALVSSIMNDWTLPASYTKRTMIQEQARTEQRQREQEERQKRERRARIEGYLASLAAKELDELTVQARELARREGGAIFKGKKIPDYMVTGYLHMMVEKRLEKSKTKTLVPARA